MTIVEDKRAITRAITGGVDTHADTHVAAALDPLGGLLGVQEFPATAAGYASLLGWLAGFGTVALVGIEGTGSFGAALARYMAADGIRIVEVDRADRQLRRAKLVISAATLPQCGTCPMGPRAAREAGASGKQPPASASSAICSTPEPFGDDASAPPPDPALYATSDVSLRRDHRSCIAGTFWYVPAAEAVAQAGADITAVACALIAVLMVYTKTQATGVSEDPACGECGYGVPAAAPARRSHNPPRLGNERAGTDGCVLRP